MKGQTMKKEKTFVDVSEDSFPLWELCKAEGWTDCDYEEWMDGGGELSFFEGDPDLIHADGVSGVFAECGETVFYWMESDRREVVKKAETMLRAFFGAYETGVTIGGESWKRGKLPAGVDDGPAVQSWDAWDKVRDGIAWRGGAGYVYEIQDWAGWVAAHAA